MKLILERLRNPDLAGNSKYIFFMYRETPAEFRKNEKERSLKLKKHKIKKEALDIECCIDDFPNQFYMVFDIK